MCTVLHRLSSLSHGLPHKTLDRRQPREGARPQDMLEERCSSTLSVGLALGEGGLDLVFQVRAVEDAGLDVSDQPIAVYQEGSG